MIPDVRYGDESLDIAYFARALRRHAPKCLMATVLIFFISCWRHSLCSADKFYFCSARAKIAQLQRIEKERKKM